MYLVMFISHSLHWWHLIMNSKYCLLSFCISFAYVSAQNCSTRISGPITDGVHAELICSDSGLLLGIRVSWSWLSSDPVECFQSPEVQLVHVPTTGSLIQRTLDSTSRNNSIEFNTTDLDCNQMYLPRVRATLSNIGQFENGNEVFFGGSTRDPPAVLPRVCVGPSTLPQHQGRVNISWDPLPCHLQNGADVTGNDYIIKYTRFSNGIATRITRSHSDVECSRGVGGLYSCVVAESLIPSSKSYSIQVAAQNNFGEGLFSEPINVSVPIFGTSCTYSSDARNPVGSTTIPVVGTSSDAEDIITSRSPVASEDAVTSTPPDTSKDGVTSRPPVSFMIYIITGVVIAIIALGIVIALVAVVLLMKARKKRNHTYATVSDLKNKTSTSAIEMVPENKTSSLEINPIRDDNYNYSENEENTTSKISMKNILYEPASEPKITDFQPEIHANSGEQVTLRVNFTGIPKPAITWTFKGTKMEGDYATELGTDGSLLFVCVEKKHAGRYHFEVINTLGSVKGCVVLAVHEGEGGDEINFEQNFESNLVSQPEFGEYVASLHSCNNSTFILQYESLVSGEEGKEVKVGKSEANRPLNRFRNITAYDDRRISLEPLPNFPECQNDYINASYIDGYSATNKYVASQGPLPKTVTDFWRLVWQEKVRTIAMVTNIMEGMTKKCEQYWPEGGSGQSYGPFNLSLVEQLTFADYIVRTFRLEHTGQGGSSRKVMQYHFTSWPDHGVPEYAGPTLNYLRRIKAQHKPSKGPILVHCSAGVGRTGTLIAIDIALSQASKEKQVDIPKIIAGMRRQRMKMVQTVDQYSFIHDAVLETLICGDTQIPASDLRRALDKLKKADKHVDGMTGFCKQFQVLSQVSPNPIEIFCDCAKRYPNKNRNNNFLPPDKWRVAMKGDSSNYIHASFANGYKLRKGFIIAQSPMATTVKDFVKMLYERECGVVVMLCGCEEGGVELCAQYWPATAATMMKYGEFVVSTVSIDSTNNGFIQRNLTITDPKSGQVQKVTQFQVDEWNAEGLCSNRQALVHVIDQMGVAQRRTGNKPIVVHGSDTVSRVGVFCSLVNAIEMCKTEGVVDVFQVVKALRIQKPGAVMTVDQYQVLFDLILLFLDSFSIYSNFK